MCFLVSGRSFGIHFNRVLWLEVILFGTCANSFSFKEINRRNLASFKKGGVSSNEDVLCEIAAQSCVHGTSLRRSLLTPVLGC